MKLTWSPLTWINILCCKCLPPIIKMLYGCQRRFGTRLMKFLWVRTAVRLAILRIVFFHAAPNIAKSGLLTVGAAFAHAAKMSSFAGIQERPTASRATETIVANRRCAFSWLRPVRSICCFSHTIVRIKTVKRKPKYGSSINKPSSESDDDSVKIKRKFVCLFLYV
jgi:hypothetical protein